MDLVAASYVFIFTKDNAGLCGFIPVSKTVTIIVVSLFS